MSLTTPQLDELKRFERFQLDGAHRLASDPLLSQVKVIVQTTGDIESAVLQALSVMNQVGGKIGAAIVVLYPDFEVTNPNAAGVTGEMVLTARCMDAPFFNDGPDGTGISAGQLAMRTLRVWTGWVDKGVTQVVQAKGPAVEPYQRDLAQGIRGFDVTVRAPGGVSSGDKCGMPTIAAAPSGDDFLITLAGAESGGTIYYTTDGSYPGSGAKRTAEDGSEIALATAYAEPFTVPAGTNIRASGEHPAKVPSDCNHKTV